MTGFLNPYNFVSSPARPEDGDLSDGRPPEFGRIHPDLYNASLRVRIRTRTPLLLTSPDPRTPVRSAHRYTTRTGADDAPLLLGSSIKGALRAAYEAVTNSRYGVFDEQTYRRPVATRVNTSYANENLFPAWVDRVADDGTVTIRGFERLVPHDFPRTWREPYAAAWLPRVVAELDLGRENAGPKLDMQPAEAWIRCQKQMPQSTLWRVTDIAVDGDLPTRPSQAGKSEWNWDLPRGRGDAVLRVRGIIHWTGGTFGSSDGPRGPSENRKTSERFFITEVIDPPGWLDQKPYEEQLDTRLQNGWTSVIDSFVAAHRDDSNRSGLATYITDPERWRLQPGRTLWARYDDATGQTLVNLSPAMLGRKVFDKTPVELADPEHLPPRRLDQLSPADRVFGWVSPDGGDSAESAVRGRLTVDQPVVAHGPDHPIIRFDNPVALATLASPHISQSLFYTWTKNGEFPRNDGYREGDKLRGQKRYLAQPDTFDDAEYWNPRGRDSRIREYLRPRTRAAANGEVSKVAGEVSDWVAPGCVFETTISIRDVNRSELGALLWLLSLPADTTIPLGLGKPLGFGATEFSLDIERSRIWTGATEAARYRSLATAAAVHQDGESIDDLIASFDEAVDTDPGLTLVRAEFLAAATGFPGLPVHTPRAGTAPDPEGFKWWTGWRSHFSQRENEEGDWTEFSLPRLATGAPPLLQFPPERRKNRGGPRAGGGSKRGSRPKPGSQ